MSTHEELERLRRAVNRLMEAQQEALEVTDQALEVGRLVEIGRAELDDDTQHLEESERLEAALEDVRAILDGASIDVQGMLEGGDGQQWWGQGERQSFVLELVSLGIDPKTGHVPELELTCSEIGALMRRVGENQAGLKEVLIGDTSDLVAVRGEERWQVGVVLGKPKTPTS